MTVRKPKYCCTRFTNLVKETRVQLWYDKDFYIWTCEGDERHEEPESYFINFCPFCGKHLDHAPKNPPKDTNTVTYDGRSIDGVE